MYERIGIAVVPEVLGCNLGWYADYPDILVIFLRTSWKIPRNCIYHTGQHNHIINIRS
jgi:hypothetical protein